MMRYEISLASQSWNEGGLDAPGAWVDESSESEVRRRLVTSRVFFLLLYSTSSSSSSWRGRSDVLMGQRMLVSEFLAKTGRVPQ